MSVASDVRSVMYMRHSSYVSTGLMQQTPLLHVADKTEDELEQKMKEDKEDVVFPLSHLTLATYL